DQFSQWHINFFKACSEFFNPKHFGDGESKIQARVVNARISKCQKNLVAFAASDHSELHSPSFADHGLIPRRMSDDDLAHSNQTNVSCVAQIRRTMSSAA